MRRLTSVAGIVLISAFTSACAGVGQAHVPAAGCTGSWTIFSSPSPGEASALDAITAAGPDDLWAVGTANGGAPVPVIEHWNGVSWSLVSSTLPAGGLSAIDALAADDVWTVGFADDTSERQTLIAHWDGTSWSRVPSPNVGTGANYLSSISMFSPRNGIAVGRSMDGITAKTLALQWDGTTWRVMKSPNAAKNSQFDAVKMTSATSAWAVGRFYNGSNHALIAYWTGEAWILVRSPGGSNNALYSVDAVSSKELFAAGAVNPLSGSPFMERWRGGGNWGKQTIPGPATTALTSVSVAGAGDAWAVGAGDNGPTNQTAVAYHSDGHAWSSIPPAVQAEAQGLVGVVALRGEAWGVGWYRVGPPLGDQPLIEHYC